MFERCVIKAVFLGGFLAFGGAMCGAGTEETRPYSPAVDIKVMRLTGNTKDSNNVYYHEAELAAKEVLIAPVGLIFRGDVSGFGVEDEWQDVRRKWDFGDPGYFKRWKDKEAEQNSIPWDRVYDVDGTTWIVRGPKVFDVKGVEQTGKSAKKTLIGYEPDFGTNKTLLGYDSNIAYGPLAAHCFNRPGVYTVTCEGRIRGARPVVKTFKVTVLDPDVEFGGSNGKTIVVSQAGNYEGAPDGAIRATSIDEALTKAAGDRIRILFRRGETFGEWKIPEDKGKLTEVTQIELQDATHYQIGAFGSGNEPPELRANISVKSDTVQASVWGVNIRPSGYTADRPTVESGVMPPARSCIGKGGQGWTTISDVSLRGAVVPLGISDFVQGLVCSDVSIYDNCGYGFFGNKYFGGFAFVGTTIRQRVDAVVGWYQKKPGETSKKPPWYCGGTPIRYTCASAPLIFSMMDIMPLGEGGMGAHAVFRSDPEKARDPAKYITIAQPAIRPGAWNSDVGLGQEEVVFDRIRTELRSPSYGYFTAPKGSPRRHLYDKFYVVEVETYGESVLDTPTSGGVFRNGIVVMPNTHRSRRDHWLGRGDYSRQAPEKVAGMLYPGNGPKCDSDDMSTKGLDVHNCTFVNHRDRAMAFVQGLSRMQKGEQARGEDGRGGGGLQYKPFQYVKIGNNVAYSGKWSDGRASTDTLEQLDTTEIWRTSFPGIRWQTHTAPPMTEFAPPAGSYAYFEPKPGAPSKGAASTNHSNVGNGHGARIAVDDFFGNVRSTTTSRGAFD